MDNFLFRVDASPAMGTGHVMRCLALAEGLHDLGHGCHFLLAESTAALDERLAREGVVIERIDGAADAGRAGEATCGYAAAIAAAAIIVDGYQFDAAWRRRVHGLGRPVLSFFDHRPEAAVGADIVLNAAAEPGDERYRALAPAATWLLGSAYALLRRDLREALVKPPLSLADRGSILVTFGGSDPLRLTLPTIRALVAAGVETTLDVVLGGSVENASELAGQLSILSRGVRVHRDPPAMGLLMRGAGLAVSAAGGTVGELAAFGVPSLIVTVAENQEAGARRAAEAGWCRVLDGRRSDAPGQIAAATATLWRDLAERQVMAERVKGLVDGQGVVRVCRALLEAVAREP
jgi:UDP-2,4-diacetamido-2,4,6-trideoxy-beta-L-altropyranose hydrolase